MFQTKNIMVYNLNHLYYSRRSDQLSQTRNNDVHIYVAVKLNISDEFAKNIIIYIWVKKGE